MKDKFAGKYKVCDLYKMAVVVKDCKKAAEQWADVMGAGPFILSRHVQFEEMKVHGKDISIDMDAAVGMWGDIEIELIQPNQGGEELFGSLEEGRGKFHHLTWVTENLEQETKRLEELGYPKVVDCKAGPAGLKSAWFDAQQFIGGMLEVYEWSDFLDQTADTLKEMRRSWDLIHPIAYVYDCRTNAPAEEKLPEKKDGRYVPTSFNQICFLYEDCVKAAREWVRVLGAGPATVNRHIQIEELTYKGKKTEWDQDSALCQFGTVQVELMQTNDDSPAVHFQPGPNGRIHHVNWLCKNLDDEKARMAKLGYPVIWDCVLAGGEMRMCMFDAEKLMGSLCEVYEDSELNQAGYETMRKIHRSWDGKKDIAYFYDMRTYTMSEEE